MEEFKTETISMTIIAEAGEGRTLAFEALQYAKEGDFEKCDELLKSADKSIKNAHIAQTSLLTQEANMKSVEINVLLIHAQDHLMTAELANDLIKEMVEILRGKK